MDHFLIVLCWKTGIFDSANNTYRYNTEKNFFRKSVRNILSNILLRNTSTQRVDRTWLTCTFLCVVGFFYKVILSSRYSFLFCNALFSHAHPTFPQRRTCSLPLVRRSSSGLVSHILFTFRNGLRMTPGEYIIVVLKLIWFIKMQRKFMVNVRLEIRWKFPHFCILLIFPSKAVLFETFYKWSAHYFIKISNTSNFFKNIPRRFIFFFTLFLVLDVIVKHFVY